MIIDLENILGEAITVKELSEYLGINQKTLRENYRQFGGIKVGRHYRFFTREIAHAMEKRQKQIYSASQEERSATGKSLPDTEGSEGVGSKDEKAVRRGVDRKDDKHGLFS
ncbi:MAG: helix-turn-helix domain-containing protein [Deltaproteobacteria bacterium]